MELNSFVGWQNPSEIYQRINENAVMKNIKTVDEKIKHDGGSPGLVLMPMYLLMSLPI